MGATASLAGWTEGWGEKKERERLLKVTVSQGSQEPSPEMARSLPPLLACPLVARQSESFPINKGRFPSRSTWRQSSPSQLTAACHCPLESPGDSRRLLATATCGPAAPLGTRSSSRSITGWIRDWPGGRHFSLLLLDHWPVCGRAGPPGNHDLGSERQDDRVLSSSGSWLLSGSSLETRLERNVCEDRQREPGPLRRKNRNQQRI